jgi:hypothetical protein
MGRLLLAAKTSVKEVRGGEEIDAADATADRNARCAVVPRRSPSATAAVVAV